MMSRSSSPCLSPLPLRGQSASVEAMLVFLFLIMIMMPVLNYAHFITVFASERASSQARLAHVIAEAEFLYAHGASARSSDASGVNFVRLGQFNRMQFEEYPQIAPALDFRPKAADKFAYYGQSSIPNAPLLGPADQTCVSRLMLSNNLPVHVYACLSS
ncbi:MAG: hypothetical protein V1728_03135 [Candidatus Micrarchaeota archaeon]